MFRRGAKFAVARRILPHDGTLSVCYKVVITCYRVSTNWSFTDNQGIQRTFFEYSETSKVREGTKACTYLPENLLGSIWIGRPEDKTREVDEYLGLVLWLCVLLVGFGFWCTSNFPTSRHGNEASEVPAQEV